MTVWAVSMVKDEADVIEGTLRHLADEAVDAIIVADNASTDGTRDILSDLARELPLVVSDEPDPAYYQSKRMTELMHQAVEHGAKWIVPFDADELWIYQGDRIGNELRNSNADVVTAELFNHFPSAVDPEGETPFESIVWRQREPAPLAKVAFRWRPGVVIAQGNHGVTFANLRPFVSEGLEVRHFPYRSAEQFVRKARNGAAAYRATDLPPEVGAHWRQYGQLLDTYGEECLHDVYRQYFWNLAPADAGLVLDPAPYMRWR